MVLFQNCVRQSHSPTKMATTVQLRCYWKQFDPGERLQAPGSLLCCCLFSFTSLLTPHRTLVNTHTIYKCAKFGSILLSVSREDDENIVSHSFNKIWTFTSGHFEKNYQNLLRIFIETFIPKFSIYHQNICSLYPGPIDAYVLLRTIFLTVCVENYWLVDSCLSLGMLFKICCKAPYQKDNQFSYNFLDCVYASFNKGKVSKISNKSSHISELYSKTC